MDKDELTISSGNTFLISDAHGNIGAQDHHGLFSADVRHLSKFSILLNDAPLEVLTSRQTDFDSATMVLTNSTSKNLSRFDTTIIRRRTITKVLHEEIEFINNSAQPIQLTPSLVFDADFSDIFEVRDLIHGENLGRQNKRSITKTASKKNSQLVFSYVRDAFRRTTVIQFSGLPVIIKGNIVYATLALEPKQHVTLQLSIAFLFGKKTITVAKVQKIREKSQTLREWHWSKVKLSTNWDDFDHAFTQSISDLAALRIYQEKIGGKITSLPAAGIPWFVAIFGRDSLITAYQTLIFGQELSIGLLKFLAAYQGKEVNPDRDEQPGKILHEIRFGEAAYFRDWVHFPYYGTSDATPLFLILLSESYRFGAPERFIKQMKGPALKALEWIDEYGDADKDGFVEYQRGSDKGLENQNWRDSWDSMLFHNGEVAAPPIASGDIQGYVYDAKLRMAEIARNVWKEAELADRLTEEAVELKTRFNKVFWIENKGYFALGLDRHKKHIDSLSSSIGHLLWSGIVDENKVERLVDHLFSKQLYSGWGVRTMSAKDIGYNPILYHRGTVWPHDNSLVAAGLYKIGKRDLASRIILDTITASSYFGYRLPEVFAGFDRSEAPFPVRYPTAASPQAWAAATPILFLRLLLGIEPDIKRKKILIDPALPEYIHTITASGISAFGKQFTVEAKQGRSTIKKIVGT